MHNGIIFRIDGGDRTLNRDLMAGHCLVCDPIYVEAVLIAVIDECIFRPANDRRSQGNDGADMVGVVPRRFAREETAKTPSDKGDGSAQFFAARANP